MSGQGFEVVDLGVDVAPPTFADAVAVTGAELLGLGLSALLTTTLPALEQAVEQVRQRCPETLILVGDCVSEMAAGFLIISPQSVATRGT